MIFYFVKSFLLNKYLYKLLLLKNFREFLRIVIQHFVSREMKNVEKSRVTLLTLHMFITQSMHNYCKYTDIKSSKVRKRKKSVDEIFA